MSWSIKYPHAIGGILAVALVLFATSSANSQAPTGLRGFDIVLESTATGAELNAQPNLWVMEVSFKPMRMIRVPITDPKTGQKKSELVWYLVYKAINRPLERRKDAPGTVPNNLEDPVPTPLFVPEFTLMTDDNDGQKIYVDSVAPEAQAAIMARERRVLRNTVEIVGLLPELTPLKAKKENALYGVAIWRGVDPKTDFFRIFMTGFSNGYKIVQGPDGSPLAERKTIVQEFTRYGDKFKENEVEFRRKGEPRWIDRPDAAPASTSAQDPPKPPVPMNNNG